MVTNRKYKLMLVAGARPNFMKIAPIVRALRSRNDELLIFNSKLKKEEASDYYNPKIDWKIIHTGQHYDYEMSQAFFDDLEIPKPDYFLEAGSGSHAEQTAKIMISFEKVCERERPDVRSQRSGARGQRSEKTENR